MKLKNKALLFLCAMLLMNSILAQTLITEWTFESNPLLVADATPGPETGSGSTSIIGAMNTPSRATGSSAGCAQTTGTGAWALGVANPGATNESSGAQFLFSTVGYQNIKFKFDQRFSNTAVRTARIQYTIDGNSWNNLDVNATNFSSGCTGRSGIDLGRIDVSDPVGNNASDAWVRREVDFSAITGANNNANFGIRILAAHYGTTGEFRQANNIANIATAGTWRFDNVAALGDVIPQSQVIHYWNFNSLPAGTLTTVTPDISVVPSGTQITYPGTGAGFMDNVNPGSAINAINGDPAGLGLRPRNPSNTRELLIAANTTGYENIVIKFATAKTTQGATEQYYDYSIDGGINYITTGLTTTTYFSQTEPNYELVTHDLSAITTIRDNAGFIFRIRFGGTTAAGSSGNNRFDNITVEGTPYTAGPDINSPFATFNPANNATNVVTTVTPTISFNENVRLINNNAIDNNNVDAIVELRLNNASGALVPFDATFANNVITITPLTVLQYNQPYYVALLGNTVEDFSDNAIINTESVSFTTEDLVFATKVSFASNFITVNENAGSVNVTLNLVSPATASVDLVLKGSPFSTADINDFTFATQTINFTAGSGATQTITIPIIDDNNLEQAAEYFVLSLENPVGLNITGNTFTTIYIKDNDRVAPVPTNDIELSHVGSFDPSGSNNSTCEIVVHDPASQRLFTTSAVAGFLDIIDFSNPANLSLINSIDMNSYGGVTSVAVKNGIVAVASPNANEQLDGSVVFFNTNGTFLKQVTVGALPDMITFTPEGLKVITANEGQPNSNYTIDPEGSVSIIDISGGIANLTQANVTTLLFTAYNTQEAALIAAGVRKLKLSSTLSQDLEPEYVTVSNDSKKAWVTLQENNAIAEIDLDALTYTGIWALGTKDYSVVGSGYDASDNNGQILIANWPVKAFYIPDAIAQYNAGGINYLVTANEGDEKEYTGFVERTTVGANNYILDPVKFPNANVLKQNHNLGRFRVTNLNGDTDNDGDFDEIYCVGSRSFSIWNADTKTLVYDSGDDFEMYTANTPGISSIFNADHESNTAKNRSRAKGPEPEGVVLGEISNKTYSFISLERIGGVMVYDVTNPANVKLVDYKNTRNLVTYGGDNGAEGITFIKSSDSPTGKDYVLVANEISGTITVYEVVNNNPSITVSPLSPSVYCAGDSVTVSFTGSNVVFGGGNQFQIELSNTAGNFPGTVLGTTANSPFKAALPTNAISGNAYKIRVVSSNPQIESAGVSLTINALPNAQLVNGTVNDTVCAGTSVVFTASGGNNYQFSLNGTVVQTSINASYTNSNLSNGSIVKVRVTNSNSCIAFAYDTIIVKPLPTVSLGNNVNNNTICAGDEIVFTASGADNFEYFVNNVSVQNSNTALYTSNALSNNDIVRVRGTLNGCSANSNLNVITVNELPVVSLTSNAIANTFCENDVIEFTSNGGVNYEFFVDAVSEQSGTDNSFVPTVMNSGSIVSVKVEDATGCIATPAPLTVVVNDLPQLNLGNDTIVCLGNNYRIQATNFNKYSWSTGATTSFINVNSTNTYVLTVTDANGCENSDAILVTFDVCSGLIKEDILSLSVYPNPAENILNVTMNQLTAKPAVVKLIGLDGKVLLQQTQNTAAFNITLDISMLPSGIYLLQVQNNNSVKTQRVIIQ